MVGPLNPKANLQLSKNTYAIVLLSADLFNLITESQSSLVPFENIQLEQEVQGVDGEAALVWMLLLVKQ